MPDTLYGQAGLVVVTLVTLFAFARGDEPERVGAGAYAVAMMATLLVQDDGPAPGTQWPVMAVDLAMLVVYVALAWKCRRAWPVWASAVQAVILMIHIMTVLDVRPPTAAVFAVMNLGGYLILAALLVGTLQAWGDRRAAGLS